ncbi:MAG TPA: hypothetical protein VK673_13740 [Chthoniobacterales bacterium]|nr:hypothetical protein [Chthoniobacterales bacterium]
MIQEIDDQLERLKALARKHLDAVKTGKTSMIVSLTHAEARVAASTVRQELRAAGVVGVEESVFERLESLSWTEAEKRDPVNYARGQIVEFHRMTKGAVRDGKREPKFLSGEQWRVKRKEAGSVITELERRSVASRINEAPGPRQGDPANG